MHESSKLIIMIMMIIKKTGITVSPVLVPIPPGAGQVRSGVAERAGRVPPVGRWDAHFYVTVKSTGASESAHLITACRARSREGREGEEGGERGEERGGTVGGKTDRL